MNIIYEILSGSHAFGLDHQYSDEDIRGIFVPTPEELLGFGHAETREQKPDKVYHSLRKYLHLALKANPSILSWLWVRDDLILQTSPCAQGMRESRKGLLSRRCYKTFGGYAVSQLKKMEASCQALSGYALHGERDATQDPASIKAGYDTKNAMHLIRILRSGLSLLIKGDYEVYRENDRKELLSIRAGEWRIDKVIAEAQSLMARMDSALISSPLPESPDQAFWEDFLVRWHRYYLH